MNGNSFVNEGNSKTQLQREGRMWEEWKKGSEGDRDRHFDLCL